MQHQRHVCRMLLSVQDSFTVSSAYECSNYARAGTVRVHIGDLVRMRTASYRISIEFNLLDMHLR